MLPSVTLLPEAKLSYPQLSPKYSENLFTLFFHQQARKSSAPENIQRLFINNPKIFKDPFACKIVLAANYQQPKQFKDFFACRIVIAANHQRPKIFKDFLACRIVLAANHQHPGNVQRVSGHQQQQPAAAISSSDQQQQPAAATSSSNQQQRPATATSSSNQQNNRHQQSAFILPAAPTQSTPTFVS